MKREVITILILTIMVLTLSGCWDYREINELAILTAVAIDEADEMGKYKLTAQVINTGNITPPGGGGGSPENAYFNISVKANTVFEGTRKLTRSIDRKLYGSHMKVLIISNKVAEKGIARYIDLFIRDPEPRNDIYLLISEGKAADVLNVEPEMEKINGTYIHNLVEVKSTSSQSVAVTLQEFTVNLLSQTVAPCASSIKVENNILNLSGAAVFKKDKYIGKLNPKETRGFLWVTNKVESGILVAKGYEPGDKISFETVNSNSKIKPFIKDNEIHFDLRIYDESKIGESEGCINLYSDSRLNSMKRRKATVIANEVKAALKKTKSLEVDIFGFGEIIHQRHPKKWEEIKHDWDNKFQNLKVNIYVKSSIKRSGMTLRCIEGG